jgi:hypothetical protein
MDFLMSEQGRVVIVIVLKNLDPHFLKCPLQKLPIAGKCAHRWPRKHFPFGFLRLRIPRVPVISTAQDAIRHIHKAPFKTKSIDPFIAI